jgi:glycerophosphoryl diester phosphodiesterase
VKKFRQFLLDLSFTLFHFSNMQANDTRPLIIAHRGASALAPENTLAAFRKAIEDGADGIEFDVRFAKDRVPVVIHDAKLERLAKREGRVSHYTSQELQSLDVGSWFNDKNPHKSSGKFSLETVPTLESLLAFLGDYKGLLYLEIKCREDESDLLVETVCQLIRQSDLLPQIIVKSFNLEAVRQARRLLPEIRTAALFAPKILDVLRKKKRLFQKAQECEASELSIHFSLATEKFVRRAAKKNLPVTIWTANNPVWVRRAVNLGINAIITNNPARLIAMRDEVIRKKTVSL